MLGAVFLDEANATIAKCLQIGPARDERDRLARQGQPRPQITADSTGTHDSEFHEGMVASRPLMPVLRSTGLQVHCLALGSRLWTSFQP